MNMFGWQLAGLLRYEVLMQFRRRTFVLIILGLVGGLFAFAWSQHIEQARLHNSLVVLANQQGIAVERLQYMQVTLTATATLLGTTLLIALVVVPVLVAPTIPLDQQYGIQPLLESLPLSRNTYLLGKVASVWFSLVVIMLVFGLGAGTLIFRLLLGPFDWLFFLQAWLLLLGLLLIISALSVLAAAGQTTMRRAMLIGVIVTSYLIFWTIRSMAADNRWAAFSPIQLTALLAWTARQIRETLPGFSGMADFYSPYQSIGAMFAAASATLAVVWLAAARRVKS